MAVFCFKKPCDIVTLFVYSPVKKINLNTRALLKTLSAALLFGLYWFWINKKLISESNQVFGLGGFFLLICVATAYFPLPANLLVLGAVKANDPLLVAVVGGLGTVFSYFTEYLFFTLLFKLKKVANFKNNWLYLQAGPLFDRAKFFILSFASFLPIPSEPLRIYAITTQYPRVRYMLAGLVGRIPRYFLLGYFGKEYVNSVWFLGAVIIFPVFFLLVIRAGVTLTKRIRIKLRATKEKTPVSVPIAVPTPSAPFPDGLEDK